MDIEKFKKESKEVFDNEVKPQIANAKMTAVEWLIENLISEPYSEQDFEHNFQCWEQAKEMEKEQLYNWSRCYNESR